MHERQECESRAAAAVDAMDDRIGPKAANFLWEFYMSGASRGTRTPDLVLTKDLLYQLSY